MCTGLWKRGVVDNSLYRKFVCNHPSFPLKGAVPRDWIQRERAMLERREASARSVGTLASPRVLSESNHDKCHPPIRSCWSLDRFLLIFSPDN
jgi:hypothetical protein